MSKFKRIIIWSLVALSLQCLGLLFIDKFFWQTETKFTLKKINMNSGSKKIGKIKVPNSAKDISISFDGQFLSYYENNNLIVVNNYTGDKNTVKSSTGYSINFYEWMPDRNRLLLAEKQTGTGTTLKFCQYEPSKKNKGDLVDNHGNLVKLKLSDSKGKVENVAMSMQNNIFYFKINQFGKSSIYTVNVMSQMTKVANISIKIGDIKMMQKETKLLYDDLVTNKVKVTGKNTAINITGESKLTVLGISSEDTVYVGSKNDDKVWKVYYGNLSKPTSTWTCEKLPDGCSKEDIFVLSNGKVYVNDSLKGSIIDLSNGKKYDYKGVLIEVIPRGIASIDDGVLKLVEF